MFIIRHVYTGIEFKYVERRISPAFVFVDGIGPVKTFEIAVDWIYERGPKRCTDMSNT